MTKVADVDDFYDNKVKNSAKKFQKFKNGDLEINTAEVKTPKYKYNNQDDKMTDEDHSESAPKHTGYFDTPMDTPNETPTGNNRVNFPPETLSTNKTPRDNDDQTKDANHKNNAAKTDFNEDAFNRMVS